MKVIFGDQNNKDYGEGWVTVDWRNADVNLFWNEGSKFKFWDDNWIDMFYTSHVIEHMTDEAVEDLFREFYRVLTPGGGLRVVAPNIEAYIDSYKTPAKEKFYIEEYGVGSGRTFFEEIVMCIEMCGTDIKLLQSHNMLCLMICAYCDRPNDGVLFSKEEVNSKLKELYLDDFISWVASHYDLNRPGGHINGFYPDKVIRMLTRAGFKEVRKESFRESRFEEVKTNENLDLLLRKNISLYVEAIK